MEQTTQKYPGLSQEELSRQKKCKELKQAIKGLAGLQTLNKKDRKTVNHWNESLRGMGASTAQKQVSLQQFQIRHLLMVYTSINGRKNQLLYQEVLNRALKGLYPAYRPNTLKAILAQYGTDTVHINP